VKLPGLAPRPIRRLLAIRLLVVAAATIAVLAVALSVVQARLHDRAAQRQLDDTLQHLLERTADIDDEWLRDARLMAGQLVFSGLLDLEDAALQQARLSAYFDSLGELGPFAQAQLLDAQGRALVRYGAGARLIDLPAKGGTLGWAFSESDHAVYRVMRLPVRLGIAGNGTLALLAPLDDALLDASAPADVALSLHWRQANDVAASRPLDPRPPSGAQVYEGTIAWAGDPGGPRLHVTRMVVPVVGRGELLAVIGVAGGLSCLLGWLVLGAWLGRVSRRLRAMMAAMVSFAESRQLEPGLIEPYEGPDSSVEMQRLRQAFRDLAESVKVAEAAQRGAQKALRELNADLERRVDERTRELAAARDAALAATRAKEEFLANMSHELRTPLSGLLGSLELLDRQRLGGEQRELFDRARQCGEALLAVINDVLDYSKIGAGKLELHDQAFNPGELLAEVIALVDANARRKGLELVARMDCPPDLVVSADRMRLRQILLNLAGNAVKFTDRGRVELELHARVDAGAQALLRYDVTDTGPGLDAAAQDHLFEPFEQADASPQRRAGGSGLGLAISQQIARAMGSRIELRSAPGQGARFGLSLRCPVVASAPPLAEPIAPETLRGHVLLVEDNEVNRLVAIAMLERLGLEVDVCTDGVEAVQWLERHRTDLVLMDCQMPGLDGFGATRRIRADEARAGRPRCPIVALTANALSGDAERCVAAGMDDHLAKPYSEREFALTLARWLPATAAVAS
jgi:signal transduction histidine kinase/CheY-like chemotaxis protein